MPVKSIKRQALLILVLKTPQKFRPRHRQARRGINRQLYLLTADTGNGYFDLLSGLVVRVSSVIPGRCSTGARSWLIIFAATIFFAAGACRHRRDDLF